MLFLLRRTHVKTLKHLNKFLPIDDDFKNTELISDDEHEKNVNTIRNINRNIDIKVCAGGNINRLEDIKKLLNDTPEEEDPYEKGFADKLYEDDDEEDES